MKNEKILMVLVAVGALYYIYYKDLNLMETTLIVVSTIFCGAGITIIGIGIRFLIFKKEEKKILTFFEIPSKYEYRTVYPIASATNLTEKRVKHICNKSKKFIRNTKERDSWKLKRSVQSGI